MPTTEATVFLYNSPVIQISMRTLIARPQGQETKRWVLTQQVTEPTAST